MSKRIVIFNDEEIDRLLDRWAKAYEAETDERFGRDWEEIDQTLVEKLQDARPK